MEKHYNSFYFDKFIHCKLPSKMASKPGFYRRMIVYWSQPGKHIRGKKHRQIHTNFKGLFKSLMSLWCFRVVRINVAFFRNYISAQLDPKKKLNNINKLCFDAPTTCSFFLYIESFI